tara:strand:- start:749 stop:1072 length:324 start_codon:yes stop_codon:yes gene_type:complete
MALTKMKIEQTYDGLTSQKQFFEGILLSSDARSSSSTNIHIERIKKVLALLTEGLQFFESNWIHTKGKKEGQVKKFRWFNPASWRLMGKTTSYYADLFARIAEVYKQ